MDSNRSSLEIVRSVEEVGWFSADAFVVRNRSKPGKATVRHSAFLAPLSLLARRQDSCGASRPGGIPVRSRLPVLWRSRVLSVEWAGMAAVAWDKPRSVRLRLRRSALSCGKSSGGRWLFLRHASPLLAFRKSQLAIT